MSSLHQTSMQAESDELMVAGFRQLSLEPQTHCLLLTKLPIELRLQIYEHALRLQPATITFDLWKPSTLSQSSLVDDQGATTYELLSTCQQIYKECGNTRYMVNSVRIFAPVFHPRPQYYHEVRAEIIGRLERIPDLQIQTKLLRRARVFLGRFEKLERLRWMSFFPPLQRVWAPVRRLEREGGVEIEVALEIVLKDESVALLEFGTSNVTSIRDGFARGMVKDGKELELSEKEADKLARIRGTIERLAFPE